VSAGSSVLVRPTPAPALIVGAALLTAVGYGALTGVRTGVSLLVLTVVLVTVIALFAPLGAVSLLLFATVLVPYATQNRYALAGGTGVPGILVVDLLLILSVARVTVGFLARRVLPGAALFAYLLLLGVGLQLIHGILNGAAAGDAGLEARNLANAIAGFLLAIPVLQDPVRRARLPAVLLGVALCAGLWGLAQWVQDMPFNGSDFGVRKGEFGTESGRGQLQGGLYFYPAAVVLAFAALVSDAIKPLWLRALTLVALAANGMCLLLTYERTFWLAAALGCAFVALRSPKAVRRRAMALAGVGFATLVAALGVASPTSLRTALERGSSVADVQADDSGAYRVAESEAALEPIRARPIDGSGFGTTITWEPPQFRGKEVTDDFIHNGYVWLVWKTGVLFAALWAGVIILSALHRPPASEDPLLGILRVGAQATLLGLLVINVTFPSFNALGIAAATGLLVALCWVPRAHRPQWRPPDADASVFGRD
jgi:hypothetical protein